MKTLINKIIAVEGLDKTGKTTFVNAFDTIYHGLNGTTGNTLKKFSFPNQNTPIGKAIRDELGSVEPDTVNVVNSPNFLGDMAHYWMEELFHMHFQNTANQPTNNINVKTQKPTHVDYIFDRYFISTLTYQAFYNDSKADLEYIKMALSANKFIKMPTDIILFDLPNEKILERTLADQENGLVDANDTTDIEILNKRRESYKASINFLKGKGITIHWFEDVSLFDTDDLAKVLMGKIFG